MKDMRKYKSRYVEEIANPEVAQIIQILQTEDFRNKDQRKKMIRLLVNLFHLDNEREVRKFFKLLGDACTNIGQDLLAPVETEANSMMDVL